MMTFGRHQGEQIAALALCSTLLMAGQAAADQVIPDDLIVQGSTCVGFDCVNNEPFGFDTLKLKENNLQIFFEDTSTSTGFPTNDWRLVANDSASGGSNFFAIQDATAGRQVFKVEAGAPSNALFVDSAGNVGISTATPVLDLHINTGNTPAHRLEQNASGGFTAQTWDIGANEANFFVRDVTSGSRLPLRIRPGAPTSSIDINATGNVGIGTASPAAAARVHVFSNATSDIVATFGPAAAANTDGMNLGYGGSSFGAGSGFINAHSVSGNSGKLLLLTDANARLVIDGTGNVGVGTTTPAARLHTIGSVRLAGVASCSSGIVSNASGDLSCLASSRQFKTIAGDLAPQVALANVMALRPQVGAYKETPDVPEHWLIAEEVAAVDPALVGTRDGDPYTVKLQGIVTDLVAVVQQQQRRIDALERATVR